MKEIKNGTCELALAEEEIISLNMALEYEDENIGK